MRSSLIVAAGPVVKVECSVELGLLTVSVSVSFHMFRVSLSVFPVVVARCRLVAYSLWCVTNWARVKESCGSVGSS